MILVALTPSPEEILRCHTEECIIPVEKGQAFPALKKIKFIAFPIDGSPIWINNALKYLSLTDFGRCCYFLIFAKSYFYSNLF